MKLVLILSVVAIAQAGVIKEEKECEGIKINDVYHTEEILKEDLDRPYLLAVDRGTDTLYFSYNVEENSDNFKSARIDLNTNEFKTIDDISNGFAQTVDPETHNVYIGGSDGLFKYDYKTHKSESLGEKGSDIWNVFFKDVLYFSVFPSQFLYTFSDGEVTKFRDLQDTKVDHFIIDSNDMMYFTNDTGLYGQQKGTDGNATLYAELSDIGARGLTIDAKGRVYVCFQNGISVVNKETNSLDSVVELEDAFGVAFDSKNNLIYSDARRLVRLTPKEGYSC